MEQLLALPLVLKIAIIVLAGLFLFGMIKRAIKLVIIAIVVIIFITVVYPLFNY